MPTEPTARYIAGQKPPETPYDADIIILSLNRLEDTSAAIASALAQRGGLFHITVLDQGSDDETVFQLRAKFGGAPRFVFYAAPHNLGVGGGRNFASALGHGRIIIALDNDAVFENDSVAARACAIFDKEPSLGALSFAILAACGTQPDLTSWGYPASLLPRYRERFTTTTFVGAGHAIRRAAWNSAGGYDPDLFFTWEEYDFALRAIARSWKIAYDGSLAVIHKVAADQRVGWSDTRGTLAVRNRLMIARKWGVPWPALLPRMAGYLIQGARNGRLGAAFAGIKAAWLAPVRPAQEMPEEMRRYIRAHETRHRGGLLARLRNEVWKRN